MGGFLAGLSVLPRWIVTTSLMVTVTRLDHRGPLRVHGRVLRRGRNAVVAGLDVVDEGRDDGLVAASTATFAVLDPGDMNARVRASGRRAHAAAHRPTHRPRRSSSASSRARGADHPAGAGRPPAQPVGHPPRGSGGHAGRRGSLSGRGRCTTAGPGAGPGGPASSSVAAADTVLHYLRPVRVGPVEARCRVLGGPPGRTLVRVAVHDLGADDRLVSLGSVVVLAV